MMYLGWRPEQNTESRAEVMTVKLVVERLSEMFAEGKPDSLALYEDVLQADNERLPRGRTAGRPQKMSSNGL